MLGALRGACSGSEGLLTRSLDLGAGSQGRGLLWGFSDTLLWDRPRD